MDIFISYSSKDEKEAIEISEKLEKNEITFFLAKKSIKGGEVFRDAIRDALEKCSELFLLLTPNSLKSNWVTLEYSAAWALKKHIVPILLRCTVEDLPDFIQKIQARDFHDLDNVISEFTKRSTIRSTKKSNESDRKTSKLDTPKPIPFFIKTDRFSTLFKEKYWISSENEVIVPLEFVKNPSYNPRSHLFPDFFKNRIMIDTIHAGDVIPYEFHNAIVANSPAKLKVADIIREGYDAEKDWGANYLAFSLCQALNLEGFYKVNIARILLDYGRFPGITQPGADYLRRYAINYPFSYYLSYTDKKRLLEKYYDVISTAMEKAVENIVLKFSIHTYDKYNPSADHKQPGTIRPLVSLLYAPIGYHEKQRMPYGVFDRLYPDVLGEFTADRILAARIALHLEKNKIPVAHNHPYHLPEGSMEVRSQVWFFFNFLRKEFEKDFPDTVDSPAYKMVWAMLMDTNLRSSESEILRSHLHMFRKAHSKRISSLENARKAYENIEAYLNGARDQILKKYKYSSDRQSSLAIEIRKDYLWEFEDTAGKHPAPNIKGLKVENLKNITEKLAEAILVYLNKDTKINRS